jgi:hypothetical protein
VKIEDRQPMDRALAKYPKRSCTMRGLSKFALPVLWCLLSSACGRNSQSAPAQRTRALYSPSTDTMSSCSSSGLVATHGNACQKQCCTPWSQCMLNNSCPLALAIDPYPGDACAQCWHLFSLCVGDNYVPILPNAPDGGTNQVCCIPACPDIASCVSDGCGGRCGFC